MTRLAVLLLLGSPGLVLAQTRGPERPPEPPALLRKVFAARDKVRFVGVRVVQLLEQGEKRVVTERIVRDGQNIRIEVMDGPKRGQIAVENAQTRKVWSPDTNEIREMPARESEFVHRLGRLGGRGREGRPEFVESEGGKIAGVPTRLLEMKSKSGSVLNQTWIDPVRGLVLKFQTLEGSGKRNGYIEFTSIRYDAPIPAGSFMIDKPNAKVITLDDELRKGARQLGFRLLRIGQNSGWKLVSVRTMEPSGTKVLMQVYRNQQMQVSLFQMQGQVDREKLRSFQGGRMASHVWEQSGYKMVLMGNVPVEGLRRLASTVSG